MAEENPRYVPGTPENEKWVGRIELADRYGLDHVFLQPSSSLGICRVCGSLVPYGAWPFHREWHDRLLFAIAKTDVTVEDI